MVELWRKVAITLDRANTNWDSQTSAARSAAATTKLTDLTAHDSLRTLVVNLVAAFITMQTAVRHLESWTVASALIRRPDLVPAPVHQPRKKA